MYPPLLAALADDSFGVRMRASVVDADAGVIDVTVVSDAATARKGGRHGGWSPKLASLENESGLGRYPALRQFFGG